MSLELDLAGRCAVVTGASAGIGAGIARRLAAEGVHLYLSARSKQRLEALATELHGAHGVDVTPLALDLGHSDAQQELAAAAAAADILVNNAGAIPSGTLEQVDEATWRTAWDLKVFAAINLSRALYASMRERGRGVILNVIGTAADKPTADYIAGSTANAALVAFTRAMGSAWSASVPGRWPPSACASYWARWRPSSSATPRASPRCSVRFPSTGWPRSTRSPTWQHF